MVLDAIKVDIIGAESLGVRSMCCMVNTPDLSLLLDPGCSLGPRKAHEIPHPLEYRRLFDVTDRITSASRRCGRIFISHYHHDHYKPRLMDELYIHTSNALTKELYASKELYIKAQKQHVGRNQGARCRYFKQSVSRLASTIHEVDARRFTFGNTRVEFSHPVPHGEAGTKLGYVLMVRVSYEGEHFVFAPDVQGPVVEDSLKFMLDTPVDMVFLGGPPLYLEPSLKGFPFDVARRLVAKIHRAVPVTVIDHHCCRDEASYQSFINSVQDDAKEANKPLGHVITSAAGYMGVGPAFLESSRASLYATSPPGEAFIQWMNEEPGKRNQVVPPVE